MYVVVCSGEGGGYWSPVHGEVGLQDKKIQVDPLPHPHLVSSFPSWAKEALGSQFSTADFSLPSRSKQTNKHSWFRRSFQGTCLATGPHNLLPLFVDFTALTSAWNVYMEIVLLWLWLPFTLRTRYPTKPRTLCVVLSYIPNPEMSVCHWDVFNWMFTEWVNQDHEWPSRIQTHSTLATRRAMTCDTSRSQEETWKR